MAVQVSRQPSGSLPVQREASLLAESLRSSRLTTLYGAAGSGKTPLLHDAVLPLLHRRASDATVPQELLLRGVVLPFPDRRRATRNQRSPEVAVCFDDWSAGGDTLLDRLLTHLHDAIGIAAPQHEPDATKLSRQHALVSTLAALDARFGVRFLIILDGFEQCLAAAPERPDIGAFLAELAHALERPQLPANFLIALRDDAKPQLDRLLANVPLLGDNVLQLNLAPAQRPPPMALHQVPTAAPPEPLSPEPDAAKTVGPSDADWLSSINAIMERVSVVARAAPAPVPVPVPADGGEPVAPELPHEVEAESRALPSATPEGNVPAAPPAPPTLPPPQAPSRARAVWLAVPALALAVLGYSAWHISRPAPDADVPSASPVATRPAPVSAKPTVAAPPPAPRALAAATRGLDGRPAMMAELASALPTAESRVTPVWPAGFDDVPGQPGLALARYDALQAQRQAGTALALQIVAPMFTEPVLFVARADSPFTFIHDIEGASIDVGPAGSGRALTAASLYQRLFAKPLATTVQSAEGGDAALGRLLRNDGVDVLVFSGPQLAEVWSRLPPATAGALKLLKRDDKHPADQRALKAYLPAALSTGTQATPTFAVMSFLVADTVGSATRAAQALCAALPELQRSGNPKWRELQGGLQLPTGWPSPVAAQQAWRDCPPARRRRTPVTPSTRDHERRLP